MDPPHMAEQKLDNQLEHTYSSYVRIQDVGLKTCQRRWMTGRSGERGSGISVLAARYDDGFLNMIPTNDALTSNLFNMYIPNLALNYRGWYGIKPNQMTKNIHVAIVINYMLNNASLNQNCPVGRGCRIHRLLLCSGVRHPAQRVTWYDTKQAHGEAPVMLKFWGIWSIPSLPSLPGSFWPGW